ncbi:hypothetical protein PSN45_001677 [Yamadazyma tenuis]|uniref:Permease n=1 Tax=Candida tenuis (strain ATCC 10573 / BCRC 21748 / CBS 615 / JCM 9827 / NBRC 10315 / NRRL Y-1498 / VKM Y-70) TaxID=590646 RepID=G3BEJ7_CANTC|nr:permease [Yamadazyma tenuis ATCC 10573]EGV60560.1 permease [Yamadazyma tenuis ATCC 10573]WEJ94197.1 hypothetical protein PSN45_001677 [Yamadazyma tenuis]
MRAVHDVLVAVNKRLPATNHWLIFICSVPVALACGTLFAYSVYSTQLAEQCHLTTSQSSSLNISTVIGSAVGGLLGGILTDTYGTQIPMLISCVCVFSGYKWLYELYLAGAHSSVSSLVTAMFLIGIGSTAGYFSAIKAVAIEFPNFKGTAQSITIASFAISALLHSYLSSRVFDGDVASFLNYLHISTGLMIFIGFLFVRVEGHYKSKSESEDEVSLMQTPDLIPSESADEVAAKVDLKHQDLKHSLLHPIFWFHFVVFSIVQGLGQMYIFEVGFVVKAVYNYYDDDSIDLHHLQAIQVSLIAVFSFLGRLSSGPQSDYLVHKLHCQRHWNLVMGLCIMLVGHLLNTLKLDHFAASLSGANVFLSVVSSIIGYAYGFSFTCYPVIISDIFNMENYSFIWGLMYSSTAFGLTLMSSMFGHIYDAHSKYNDAGEYVCTEGSGCYAETFSITCGLGAAVIFLILAYIRYSSRS